MPTNNEIEPSSNNGDEKKQPQSLIDRLISYIPLERFKKPAPQVAVLSLQGIIAAGVGGMLSKQGLSIESLNSKIEQAFELPKVKAIALVINSPGGSPVQSELIYKRIRQLSEQKSIPVISFTEDIAASGGYWLACAGDEIFASENSIIGSIGVISNGFGFHEVIKKLGIERRVYTQGENKSVLDPFLPEKQHDVEIIKSIQKDIHESFKNLVRSRRSGKLNADESVLFSGEFWSGAKALEFGLVDSLGDLYSVMHQRYGDKVKFVCLGKDKNWLRKKLGISSLNSIFDLIYSKIAEKIMWDRYGL